MSNESEKTNSTLQKVVRSGVVFILIIVIFFFIEILPLHFGPRQIPWEGLIPVIKSKLPRITLIAAAAAVFISLRRTQ
ncbi:MAG: hypothetical protein GF401_05560 [Chitinivibrionales bacterium]|nr:hypothetical protein [Chitinivibrionales bacterium]